MHVCVNIKHCQTENIDVHIYIILEEIKKHQRLQLCSHLLKTRLYHRTATSMLIEVQEVSPDLNVRYATPKVWPAIPHWNDLNNLGRGQLCNGYRPEDH